MTLNEFKLWHEEIKYAMGISDPKAEISVYTLQRLVAIIGEKLQKVEVPYVQKYEKVKDDKQS